MDFKKAIGIGVAGNFTGHLEQAGEAKDFLHITAVKDAPKGIFPFYVPNNQSFVGIFPLSPSTIAMPEGSVLQPEPEVALICDLTYENNSVKTITPKLFGAYNDCSIRADAPKISRKKNWGANSKGLSDQLIHIDSFNPGGIMDSFNLVCFLKRNNQLIEYGENSEVKTYSYFYNTLTDWLIEKMNNQQDEGPLENIHNLLEAAGFPTNAIISIGATRYTEFGEKTYLEKGDEVFVVVYNRNSYSIENVKEIISSGSKKENISILHQKVI